MVGAKTGGLPSSSGGKKSGSLVLFTGEGSGEMEPLELEESWGSSVDMLTQRFSSK